MNRPEVYAHAVHRGGDLFVILNVGAHPESVPAVMFYLEMGDIEFRLAPGQQSDASAGPRETDREPLTDSPAAAGDEDVDVRELIQELSAPLAYYIPRRCRPSRI